MQKQLKIFLNENHVGLLSTCDDQKPHAVPVYYLYIEGENAFYFMSKTASKKYLNLKQNSAASITIFSEKPPTVFTAECDTEILEFSTNNYSGIINRLIEMHSSQNYYPSPISTLKKGELKLIKLNVIDFNFKTYQKDIEKLKNT